MDIDVIIEDIIEHEGLIPYQTPFRIYNAAMLILDHVLGFEIDKGFKKPENRKNFIFLKNEGDVYLAVWKQFFKYMENPLKYGLSIGEGQFDEKVSLRELFEDKGG